MRRRGDDKRVVSDRPPPDRMSEARSRTERDLDRLRRRKPGGGFLRSLSLIGSVGWPIVTFTTGAALLGHYLDRRFGTGVRITLLLVCVAAVGGTYLAYHSLQEKRS